MNEQSRPIQIRVGVVDDVFAPPNLSSVRTHNLEEFLDAVDEHDLGEVLHRIVGAEQLDASAVTDIQIGSLFEHKKAFQTISREFELLFGDFQNRKNDLKAIVAGIEKFPNAKISTYDSQKAIEEESNHLHVVFLDYQLAGGPEEAREVAKQLYSQHRAFIFLMSDQAATSDKEEGFRKDLKLLRGFFRYCPKASLKDAETVERNLLFVPTDIEICRLIHELVEGLEVTLGGNIESLDASQVSSSRPVPGQAVRRFMSVLRDMPLQDYATLCELTLYDVGFPLGDYIRRLLGAFLVDQVFRSQNVSNSLRQLDSTRFTEFLPVVSQPSESLKEIYAASLAEPIANPWGSHPWEGEGDEESREASDGE
ncbi:hypothetical protein [Mariniblastus fucicola]|uniref:Uncharacterized protein n=1 Tax=Mariniblastus fucicola TaxID=980251 RepID=A0A5B9PSF4_9BACT|nr:hypothetical protein [Mariniblastus fucicola]QEG25153.1 hypothetical protein MFFC18_50770 [Mariniblastus fucicola]